MLTTSAWPCLQHSHNLGLVFYSTSVAAKCTCKVVRITHGMEACIPAAPFQINPFQFNGGGNHPNVFTSSPKLEPAAAASVWSGTSAAAAAVTVGQSAARRALPVIPSIFNCAVTGARVTCCPRYRLIKLCGNGRGITQPLLTITGS